VTARLNPERCEALIEAVRKRYASTGVVGAADALDLTDQLEVALVEIGRIAVARNADRTEWMETYETMRAELQVLRCGDLDAFHDGELAPGREIAFRAHLATCSVCEAGLQDLMIVGAIASTAPRAH
jgi:hypothetical protein